MLLKYKNVYFGQNSSICYGFKLVNSNNGSIHIGNNFSTRSYVKLLADGGNIKIGSNVFMNNNCSINCMGNISIGDDCLFGESVKLYDHNHNFADLNKRISEQGFDIGFITIGNNCWFGSNVTVLNNVTIGDNVVIGANSLIYKSVPSNTIVMMRSELIYKNRGLRLGEGN